MWNSIQKALQQQLPSQDYNTWIRPLQARQNGSSLVLLAPNRFVKDRVTEDYLDKIKSLLKTNQQELEVSLQVGENATAEKEPPPKKKSRASLKNRFTTKLSRGFTFQSFVEGKSNQLARAASLQVTNNPGNAYNPLLIYGGVGLGKTHLMQAIGHMLTRRHANSPVAYLNSERYVANLVYALQHNAINDFKSYYRSTSALLIDDIQFLAGKERSQEEFFHTFNTLMEDQQQIVLTCDRYPKVIVGLEERLKSRFGWGLTVAIEPPDLETRVAILKSKAQLLKEKIPEAVCFFIAKLFPSNVRELEGALNRLLAYTRFRGIPIDIDSAKEALKDLILLQNRQISLENIQKTTAQYFKIRTSDMLSPRRNHSILRPRQIAMALAKELTQHSLPDIGKAFGGRDHTTVLHARRRITRLRSEDPKLDEDYNNLLRTLQN